MSGSREGRIAAKNLTLKYSEAPETWNLALVKDYLLERLLLFAKGEKRAQSRVEAYLIAKKGRDYYCLVELYNKIDTTEDGLSIEGIKPSYKKVDNLREEIWEIKKKGDYIGEGYPGLNIDFRSRKID